MAKKITNILFLLVFSAPLFAQSLNRSIELHGCGLNFVHKSVRIGMRTQPEMKANELPASFQVAELPDYCYEIVAAYLWWTVSYYEKSPEEPYATVTDPADVIRRYKSVKTGEQGPKCWDEIGTRGFRADVTSAIKGNGQYVVDVTNDSWETDGLTLMIFYRDLTAPWEGHVLINDGLITVKKDNLADTLRGINTCGEYAPATSFMIASDLQEDREGGMYFIMNGIKILYTNKFWNSELSKSILRPGDSSAAYGIIPSTGDCYSWQMMGVYYQTSSCRQCIASNSRITVTADKDTICPGETVTLKATGVKNYLWKSEPPGQYSDSSLITVSPSVSTVYTARNKDTRDCASAYGIVSVVVLPVPEMQLKHVINLCQGDTLFTGANVTGGSGKYYFRWEPATGLSNPNSPYSFVHPSVTTTYRIYVTDYSGCTVSDTMRVVVSPGVYLDAGPDKTTEYNVPVPIGNPATGGVPPFFYEWYPPALVKKPNAAVTDAIVPFTTTFFVKVTDAAGCKAYDTVTVYVINANTPRANAGADKQACPGSPVLLEGSATKGIAPYKYYWSPAALVSNPFSAKTEAKVSKTTMFILKVLDNEGNAGFDTVTVSAFPRPVLHLSERSPLTICDGDSILLDVSSGQPGMKYIWSTGDTLPAIFAAKPGIYRVDVTNSYGCTSSDSVELKIMPKPDLKILHSGPLNICEGDSVVLSVEPYDPENSYNWSTGSFAKSIVARKKGVYSISVQNKYGCKSYDSVEVTVNPAFDASITPDNGRFGICPGSEKVLSAQPAGAGYSYKWSTGDTTSEITINKAGTYSVTVSLNGRCSGSDSVDIREYPAPSVSVEGNGRICRGEESYLSTDKEFDSYLWSTGSRERKILIDKPASYSVTVTDSNGCQAVAYMDVSYIDINLSGLSDIGFGSICSGESSEKEITIKNEGTDSIYIKDIILKKGTIFKSTLVAGGVSSGSSLILKFSFAPSQTGHYSDSVIITTDYPCFYTYKFAITGRAKAKTIVSLPDTTVSVGDVVSLPLNIDYTCGNALGDNSLFEAEINYDASVLLPVIQQESYITDRGVISGMHVLGLKGRAGTVFYLTGRVMLADFNTAPIHIESFKWNSDLVETETRDGILRVNDICIKNLSRVRLLGLPLMTVSPNPARDEAEITIEGEATGMVAISVYSVEGVKIQSLILNKTATSASAILDLKNFSSGVYEVVATINSQALSQPMLIVK